MSNGESSLNLDHVVERFAESERALRQLESQITSLAKLDERTTASTQTLEESASSVAKYTEQARNLTSELADVAKDSGELLDRAHEVLDGTQLQRIEERLSENHERFDGALSAQDEKLEELQDSLGEMRQRLVAELDHGDELQKIHGSIQEVDQALGQVQSKFVTELQEREEARRSSAKRLTVLLVGVVLLQAAVLALLAFSPG